MAKDNKSAQEEEFADIREEARRNAERDAGNRSVGKSDEQEAKEQSDKKPTEGK